MILTLTAIVALAAGFMLLTYGNQPTKPVRIRIEDEQPRRHQRRR